MSPSLLWDLQDREAYGPASHIPRTSTISCLRFPAAPNSVCGSEGRRRGAINRYGLRHLRSTAAWLQPASVLGLLQRAVRFGPGWELKPEELLCHSHESLRDSRHGLAAPEHLYQAMVVCLRRSLPQRHMRYANRRSRRKLSRWFCAHSMPATSPFQEMGGHLPAHL